MCRVAQCLTAAGHCNEVAQPGAFTWRNIENLQVPFEVSDGRVWRGSVTRLGDSAEQGQQLAWYESSTPRMLQRQHVSSRPHNWPEDVLAEKLYLGLVAAKQLATRLIGNSKAANLTCPPEQLAEAQRALEPPLSSPAQVRARGVDIEHCWAHLLKGSGRYRTPWQHMTVLRR